MKIIHTADWHLGQRFYDYDRTFEHGAFLSHLTQLVVSQDADALLISGDIFDVSNPSAISIRQFYTFLKEVIAARPTLQIIVTAGNHDSPSRLEAPQPLLDSTRISIIGTVSKRPDGAIDYAALTIPIQDAQGSIAGYCLAVPFLRPGDQPAVEGSESPYTDGIVKLYEEAAEHIAPIREPHQFVIAMGHLHTSGAALSPDDKSERTSVGGVECVSPAVFSERFTYTALGHIHRAQRVGADHVRYSGSPIPMSFSEENYVHQVVLVEAEGSAPPTITPLPLPIAAPLLRIPKTARPLDEVVQLLRDLEDVGDRPMDGAPYLQVNVLVDGPEPGLKHRIQTALEGKYARLARIEGVLPDGKPEEESSTPDRLDQLHPVDVFTKKYRQTYQSDPSNQLVELFNELYHSIEN